MRVCFIYDYGYYRKTASDFFEQILRKFHDMVRKRTYMRHHQENGLMNVSECFFSLRLSNEVNLGYFDK